MADGVNLIRICEVVSIDDNTDGNRIKVRISPREDFTPIDKLPWCVPLLPQMMHIKPKVGESVLILTAVAGRDMTLRYYIGPVISQMSHLPEEPALDAKRVSPTNTERHDPATTNDVDLTNGSLPNDDDIAILGRKNSDVILTDNDVRVRCGVKLVKPENQRGFVFNTSNPSYLKLKYYEDGLDEQKKIHSTATLVADKINLIGNVGKDQFYDTRNPDDLISDDVMREMVEKAHQLPFGDILVDFLNKFRTAFLVHTHPKEMMIPCQEATYNNVKSFDLNSVLSDNVRIN